MRHWIPWRPRCGNLSRHTDGTILLALAPATLLNAVAQLRLGMTPAHLPCLIQMLSGHRCPGCGLTRALSLLWLGRWRDAVALNPLSPIVFCLLLALFCLQLGRLVISQRELFTPNKMRV